jgi:hypothetical protein
LKVDVANQGTHATDIQMTTIQQLRNSLQQKIDAWKQFQALYTPSVQLLEAGIPSPPRTTSDVITPENTKLWLPSALCSHRRVDTELLSIEWELRYAQAGDALDELRQTLRLRSYMYSFKMDWVRRQSANTRARNALSRVEAKAAAAAEKYRAARAALMSLTLFIRKVGWDNKYKVLDQKDVRGMSVPKNGESEGRRNLSWIWLVEGVGEDEDEVVQDCKYECWSGYTH